MNILWCIQMEILYQLEEQQWWPAGVSELTPLARKVIQELGVRGES
jgi:hypothetical protein